MLSWFTELLNKFAGIVSTVLPASPFRPFLREFASLPYLKYINWVVPVGKCVKVGLAWLAVITTFYIYSVIMRWVKMIGD